MGSFSFTYADDKNMIRNIIPQAQYKILVPQVFGGGYVTQNYLDYGDVVFTTQVGVKHEATLFGMLGAWNTPEAPLDAWMTAGRESDYDPVGSELSLTAESMRTLTYPLKLVSSGFEGTYEDCTGVSLPDEYQGVFGVTPVEGVELVTGDDGSLIGLKHDNMVYDASEVFGVLLTDVPAQYYPHND